MDTRTSGMLPNNLRSLKVYKGAPVNPENLSNNELRRFMNEKLFLGKPKKKGSPRKRTRGNQKGGNKTKRVKRKTRK